MEATVTQASKSVEAALAAAKELEGALKAEADSASSEEAENMCQKAVAAQAEASAAINTARGVLISRQKEARSSSGADTTMLAELGRLLTRLTKMQSDIDSQKGSLR